MIRTRICFLVLLLAPLVVYWQTTFTDYGFRDDYSNLREAREEPGNLVRFTSSHGRPLYGALLETSLTNIDEISKLWILRLASVALFTILGLAMWRQLTHSGWDEVEAAVIGLCITLLPGAQVLTSWAILWPHAIALLLAMAGFSAIETELERGGLKRTIALVGGAMIYGLAAVIYQSNALFAVVPLAAVLLVRSTHGTSSDVRWGLMHLCGLVAGLLVAYLLISLLFANGVFHASDRMDLETNPFTKIIWFLWKPLPNALALYVLRDDFNAGAVFFWFTAIAVGGLIYWGCKTEILRGGLTAKRRIVVCAIALPLLAHVVSLLAAQRGIGYRTLLPLSGLVVVLLVFALRSLRGAGKIKAFYHHGGLIVIVLIAVLTAHHNAYSLIGLPQNSEWETIRSAVLRADFPKTSRVYIVTPAQEDRATARVFADEFGSISSDSDWVPTEMFKAALHERFPVKLPPGTNCKITLGREEPQKSDYDLVIDMRKYKERAAR